MIETLSFKKTPLKHIRQNTKLDLDIWVKDESCNPTGTFKDRLAWKLTHQLIQENRKENILISCITMGNTVKSIGYYFSKTFGSQDRPQVLGLFPMGFTKRVIGPDSNHVMITGSDLMQYCKEVGVRCFETDLETRYLTAQDIANIAKNIGLDFGSHRDVSYGIGEEAYSIILKEALDEMDTLPSVICVPVGAGVLFDEFVNLVEINKLDCIVVGVSVLKRESIADKIYGYYSPYFKELMVNNIAYHLKYPKHPVITVSDDEIKDALEMLYSLDINSEPSAAAAFVPLIRNKQNQIITDKRSKILVINTGNGMHTFDRSGG